MLPGTSTSFHFGVVESRGRVIDRVGRTNGSHKLSRLSEASVTGREWKGAGQRSHITPVLDPHKKPASITSSGKLSMGGGGTLQYTECTGPQRVTTEKTVDMIMPCSLLAMACIKGHMLSKASLCQPVYHPHWRHSRKRGGVWGCWERLSKSFNSPSMCSSYHLHISL